MLRLLMIRGKSLGEGVRSPLQSGTEAGVYYHAMPFTNLDATPLESAMEMPILRATLTVSTTRTFSHALSTCKRHSIGASLGWRKTLAVAVYRMAGKWISQTLRLQSVA
jgi:hypothetical protein